MFNRTITQAEVKRLYELRPHETSTIFDENVGIGTTTPQRKLHVNGSAIINGTLNMDSNKIINVGNGTSATDAVTLGQLQSVNNTVSRKTLCALCWC